MKEIGQPQQIQLESMKTKELILSNPAFIRFAGGFELFQDLLNTKKEANRRSIIAERMFDLYASTLRDLDEEQLSDQEKSLRQIVDSAIQDCQKNNFSRDNFAGELASSPIADIFFTEWNRETDEIEKGSGMIHVNDVIAYEKDDDDEISLHIRPTGVESTALISKIKDGLEKIEVLLETGKIKANRIIMKSWLFNKKMERKARQLLGDDISIEDTSPDDNDVAAAQHLALQYNKGSLKKYLTDGEKPEVRQVVMTKDEFIARFKKV